MEITTENLLDNLESLGPWSRFGLAEKAFKHYYPWYSGLYEMNPVSAITAMATKEEDWDKLIERYHKEEGYRFLSPDYVNEF
jgi:hypothetical protein